MDIEKIIKRIQRVSLSCELKTDEGIRHFHNGHEYVEIGGLKWATMNVGAEKPTDYGLYFQWGDVQGYTASQVGSGEGQKYFGWKDYKHCIEPNTTPMTKYNDIDGKKVLDLENDAVRYHWGSSWRMPTNEELLSLHNAVNTEWITNYNDSGINGLLCTDKTDSSKVLFFPASGNAYNGGMDIVSDGGCVWSSSLYNTGEWYAWYLYFSFGDTCEHYVYKRCFGFPVRGVAG